jgi:hypothetical protein
MPTHGELEKPSRNEDEYFLKHDAELIKEMRARLDRERAEAERRAHWMKCPKCGADLTETEYHHLKVVLCPDCHGMWLDAGEIQMVEQVKENRIADFIRDLFKGLPSK